MARKCIVLQRYVPEYRYPLFSAIDRVLGASGVSLEVHCARPKGKMAARGDSTQATAPWLRLTSESSLATFPGGFAFLPHAIDGNSNIVYVSELSTTFLNSHLLLARRRSVILWGHGKSFVNEGSAFRYRVEAMMAKRADAVMTYSEAGRKSLVERGIAESHVQTIGNSTDTARLSAAVSRVRAERSHSDDHTVPYRALFIGGLDASKRIDFLAEAAKWARALDPTFMLVVAGAGIDQYLLQDGINAGYIDWIGRADAEAIAQAAGNCSALWMPGRVGLVAVDALVLGIPLITTNFPFHAPEIEFLEESIDYFFAPDSPQAFATVALENRALYLARKTKTSVSVPSIDSVARRFGEVVLSISDK